MTNKQLEAKAKKYFSKFEVIYLTSDGLAFDSYDFALKYAQRKGLEVKEFKKPNKKRVKNGTK